MSLKEPLRDWRDGGEVLAEGFGDDILAVGELVFSDLRSRTRRSLGRVMGV